MDTNAIILEIDLLHKQANKAFAEKDANVYAQLFADNIKYTYFDGSSVGKKQLIDNIESYFRRNKNISIEQYRIKSDIDNGIFTEKIAKKVVSQVSHLLILSKKKTVQTEETFKWQQINGTWQLFEVEVTLEEKY